MLKKEITLLLALALLSGCTAGTAVSAPTPDPVPANTYLAEAFTVTDGFLTYDGDCPSLVGVDVSSHQADIDWERVAGAGVEFAMVRAGYRGYTQGNIYEDEYFSQNIEGARAAGLEVGAYFFSQAVSEEEALEEADFLLKLLEGRSVTFPVAFDWERQTAEGSRTSEIPESVVTACARAFCMAVEEAGYLPMVYFSPSQGYEELELEQVLEWPFWLAHYTDNWAATSFRYSFDMWQYTGHGTVDGIAGEVDLDLCLTDFRQWSPSGKARAAEPEDPDSAEGPER